LEGSSKTALGSAVRGFVRYVNTADMHRTSSWLLHSADDVKQGGLASAVRTDQTSDFASLNIKVDSANGHHATKAHHDTANFKK
jgi:hypothetical protein